jgi:hypothetical protein
MTRRGRHWESAAAAGSFGAPSTDHAKPFFLPPITIIFTLTSKLTKLVLPLFPLPIARISDEEVVMKW